MTRLARARHHGAAMPPADFLDVALVFDPVRKRADIALGEDGDLLLDDTPATPMLISLFSDRRALPDDELPTGLTDMNRSQSLVARRGWAGDALDIAGRPIGSRLWLLDRAKESELTRRLVEDWSREALAWLAAETGTAATVTATWVRRGVLRLEAIAEGARVAVLRSIG